MKPHLFQVAEVKRIIGFGTGEAKQTDFTFMSPLFPGKVMEYVSAWIREQEHRALHCSQDRGLLEQAGLGLAAAGIKYPQNK